jgi:RNA polymerase sigma factor FliA
VKSDRPSAPLNPEHARILQALPNALRVARTIARLHGVRTPEAIDDCEQTACQAILEACPGYDETRGPLDVFVWKRVAGAVTNWVNREASIRRAGFDAALDATEEMRDTSDPFGDDDADVLGQLKAQCRMLAFTRFTGDTGERLRERPDDALARTRAFEALERALGELSELEAHLVELRYWQELSWAKVGEALGIHEKQAQRLDERLRERLKRNLRARNICEPPPSEAR